MHLTGETVSIDQPADISTLMDSGRIQPANDETRARLRSKATVEWSKGPANVSNERLRFVNI